MRTERELNTIADLLAKKYQQLIVKYEEQKKEASMAWAMNSPDLESYDNLTLAFAVAIRETELQLDLIRWFEGRKPHYHSILNSYLDEKTLHTLGYLKS